MKHVGLNVAADPFMNSSLLGIKGGLIIIVADDPSMHSSQGEQDSRFYADYAMIPCFEPTTQQEAYEMVFEAFEISEKYHVPVMMRMVTRLAHSRAVVHPITKDKFVPENETSKANGNEWMLLPALARRNYEKMLAKQENRFENYEDRMMESPFQPRLRPMLVNLVRENGEYRVIVDLKPFDGETNGINVSVEGNVLSVSGELDKKFHGNEKIINFRQAYFLDDKLEVDKMTKEKKGDKYIITIPVED